MTEYHGPELNTPADTRVRFCPSPTGTPHVGMVRTALFNWAYARHTGGKLVFRIEDTDAARDSEESFNQVLDSLHWLGINWDEGVGVGGPHEPYRQSERKTAGIYNEIFEKLVEGGYVYEDFSTPDEVKERRKAAGQDPQLGYDNYDRNLTEEQKEAYRAEGRKPVWRLRMPDEDITFNDLVRGEITFKAGTVPDYVVVRSNGDPLYPFVNPVDDALMGITHVLRGEDLLSSTPRQIALYRALIDTGVTTFIPEFGHLPYVMGQGNKKLSKRDPESNLFLLRDAGFIKEGLLNYLSLLGRALDPKDFRDRLIPYLQAAGVLGETLTERQEQVLTEAAPLVQERMQLLGEAPGLLAFLFKSDDEITVADDARKQLKESAPQVLAAAIEALEPLEDFTAANIEAALRSAIVDGLEIKPRLAFGPVRVRRAHLPAAVRVHGDPGQGLLPRTPAQAGR